MKRVVLIAILLGAVLGYGLVHGMSLAAGTSRPTPVVAQPASPGRDLAPDTLTLPLAVAPGRTFGGLMLEHGVSAADVQAAVGDAHDFSGLRLDRELQLVWQDGVSAPVALHYGLDEVHTLVVSREADGWTSRVDEVVFQSSLAVVDVRLEHSLWLDCQRAGLRGGDIVRIANTFEYTVDFNTELQPNARLELVAERLSAEGFDDRFGEIHAIRLTNGSRGYTAIAYASADGTAGWYDAKGVPLARHFLRSPLKFSRVTSGFNPKRFHPVLKKRRPHNGTDFGAPSGTAVRAVADGAVAYAGWSGGHGRFVKLRHDDVWETSYSHLSTINVQRGARVKQGQIIGRVGSSGLATGPHLHYQMWKRGTYVDALGIDLPTAPPLPRGEQARFAETRDHWLPMLPSER